MSQCGLMDKGFEYFSSLMGFLSSMSYIEAESLLPFGIEAYGTPRTEDPIATPPEEGHDDYPVWKAFDEVSAMRVVRLAAMAAGDPLPALKFARVYEPSKRKEAYETKYRKFRTMEKRMWSEEVSV